MKEIATPRLTTEQKIIRAKLGLLELAKQLGNVSPPIVRIGPQMPPHRLVVATPAVS